MNKVKLFLIADGVLVAAGLLFLAFVILRKKQENRFRDDLWAEKHKKAAEDQVDRKILLEHRPDPKEPPEPKEPRAKAEFRAPNFRGQPHEILGLPANPSKELVLRAYKHWIKRYHPDRVTHLGPKYVEQARHRAEQLNSARDALLGNLRA